MEHNDHRVIGKKLDLWHMEEDAPGMIYWHPAGWRIYRQVEDLIRDRMRRAGYEEVRSPQLLPRSLWERSGHWEKFGHAMFAVPPRQEGDREMALKPMSCPCHLQIFNSDLRSWRDLPARYAEFGACHRDEPSGSMHGILRTKAFEQDDAHVICRPDQVSGEVSRFVRMLKGIYAALGFPELSVALSLRPDVRAGCDADWDKAEADLLEAARSCGLDPEIQPGEGAFYGPKLEFALRDRQGRSWQCGTIQLDMVLPGRLGASFINEEGQPEVPVMLHHAILGSMGRFIGILLEECEGRLPFWLAPRQVAVLPISDKQAGYAHTVFSALHDHGLRPVLLDRSESLQRRLVEAHEMMVPVHLVLGKREEADMSVMLQEDGEKRPLGLDAALSELELRGGPPA